MLNARHHLRMAMRALRAAPGITTLAILCTGLGIGAVTTVYSTASAFTLHPLPQLVDADRLLLVADAPSGQPRRSATLGAATAADLATLPEFSRTAVFTEFAANVAGDDLPERVAGTLVSDGFFPVTGRTPRLGRTFTPDEMQPGADRVVVLSHGLWQRRFGGDASVVGRSVRINGEAWTVLGVMPEDFIFPAGTQLWAPYAPTPSQAADRVNRNLFMIGRLAAGVTAERATAAVKALAGRLRETWPAVYADRVLRVQAAEDAVGEGPRPFMNVLLGAVAFLLLIACANVANLLLARATGRRRETGVRIALGASRARLAGQLFLESVLIALAGGLVGILFAWWGTRASAATVPVEVQQFLPGFGHIQLSTSALIVAAIVSVVSGLLFGMAPALAGSNVDVVAALKDAGKGESRRAMAKRLRSALVVGEIALALVLVAGAALMVSTFRRLSVSDPGFRTAQVLTATVTLPEVDYPGDSAVMQFWDRTREAMGALPGVRAAELTTVLPMSWSDARAQFYVDGERPERLDNLPGIGFRRVSSGYLRALDVATASGRGFEPTDGMNTPAVAVLSETAARRFFPRGDAVGRRLVLRERSIEVVGIVRDVRANPLTSESPLDVVYVPLAQWPSRTTSLVIHAEQDPMSLVPAMQAAVGKLDARLAAGNVSSMERVVGAVTSPQSATAQMLLAAAIIALLLAAVGTYGVMSYLVARRTHELGVRIALGATRGQVVRLVVGGATRLSVAGVGLGLLGAMAMGRGMQAILFETSATDPWVLGGAAALLATVALLAGYLPARRAAAVNPLLAMRRD